MRYVVEIIVSVEYDASSATDASIVSEQIADSASEITSFNFRHEEIPADRCIDV